MNKRKVIIVSLILGIIVGVIWVLGSILNSKPSKIRIGYSPLLINMPIMIASENNYFDSLGINVELIQMSSTNNMRDAVTNGNVDFAVALGTEMFIQNNILQPGNLKALFFNVLTQERYVDAIIVKKESTINEIKELNGKNIGCYPASTIQAYLNVIAKENGISFNVMTVSPTESIQLLESGRIDALFAIEPLLTYAVKTGNYKVIEKAVIAKYIQDNIPVGAWVVNKDFYESYPRNINLLKQAIQLSINFIESQPDSAIFLSENFLEKKHGEYSGANYPVWKDGCFYSEKNSMSKFLSFLNLNDIITNPSDQSDNIICTK
jgi:ABC-type nitrate/sulfonate/bicarbonate transport system substrate-binding protein